MPAYDEEDFMDYEEELPEFENEADLDDYLNDEEYELMNQIFPHAKKEMIDYQGWDNLALKKTILENNFDPDQSLKTLKKNFKKKKPEGMYCAKAFCCCISFSTNYMGPEVLTLGMRSAMRQKG